MNLQLLTLLMLSGIKKRAVQSQGVTQPFIVLIPSSFSLTCFACKGVKSGCSASETKTCSQSNPFCYSTYSFSIGLCGNCANCALQAATARMTTAA